MTPLSNTLFLSLLLSPILEIFGQYHENLLASPYGTCDSFFQGNPNDCSTYFQCSYGSKLLRDCPPTLHWNPDITACDWPRNVRSGACIDKSVNPKPNDVAFGMEDDDTVVIEYAKFCQEGSFAKNSGDCSTFYICNHGSFISQPCGAGLHWNSEVNTCDWPAKAKCTSTQSSSSDPVLSPDPIPETSNTTSPNTTTPESEAQPEVTPVLPPSEPWTSGKKVVCYFTSWSSYRPSPGRYLPSNIDPNLCTHVIYAFALLSGYDFTIQPADSWADLDNHFYQNVTSLKSKGIKVLLALGGWNDSGGSKYSMLVNSPKNRATFTQSAVAFIKKHNFDGLDLDWEYPKCWQGNCNQGPSSDKEGFAALVKELREALPQGYLLTAAVSANPTIIDAAYDVPALNAYLDHIGIMSYDYHGSWEKVTGHISPLYYTAGDVQPTFNSNSSMYYWVQKAAQRGINAAVSGPGEAGTYTRQGGVLSYYEVCTKVKNWTIIQDPNGRMGPYAYSGNNQWISYDDINMAIKKAIYIKDNSFGGVMIWAPDMDDFANLCGSGKYPILSSISKVLRN